MKCKPKQSRKQKIWARAGKFADSRLFMPTVYTEDVSAAYVAGYKAAMSDMRKLRRDPLTGRFLKSPAHVLRIEKFLRPIR